LQGIRTAGYQGIRRAGDQENRGSGKREQKTEDGRTKEKRFDARCWMLVRE